VLIIGIPFAILFLGSVRVLSLVEGRIVETMLGERMPRRPLYTARGKGWVDRINDMFCRPAHVVDAALHDRDAAARHPVLHPW
jgi:hypothetical protein